MAQGSLLFHGTLNEFQAQIIKKALAKNANATIPNYVYEEDFDASLKDQSLLRKNQAEETHSLEQYLLELSEIKVA